MLVDHCVALSHGNISLVLGNGKKASGVLILPNLIELCNGAEGKTMGDSSVGLKGEIGYTDDIAVDYRVVVGVFKFGKFCFLPL